MMMSNTVSGNEKQKLFSSFVAACFTLNFIMGTGILTIPWAFHEAGVVLSCLSLTLVCLLGIFSSDYLLSAMARAEAVTEHMNNARIHSSTHGLCASVESMPLYSDSKLPKNAENSDGDSMDVEVRTSTKTLADRGPSLMVQNSKFELTELCRIFLGPLGEKAYAVSVMLFLYGVLWAYPTVFGKAMTLSLPISGLEAAQSYSVYVGVYSLMVVPLSFLELTEQVTVQMFLSSCRFVMVAIMVFTPLLVAYASPQMISQGSDETEITVDASYFAFGGRTVPEGATAWNTHGFDHMLPVVVFAILFHHGIPSMAKDVSDKANMHNIFGITLALCIGAYAVVGVVDSWFFGEHVEKSVNLNWSDFRYEVVHDDDRWSDGLGRGFASVVSFYTVIFPALDVISGFPLGAVVLSSILRTSLLANTMPPENEERLVRLCKFVSCVPPLVGAVFLNDLGTITDYSGLVGLAVVFCFPPLLFVFSERRAVELGLTADTRYERLGSSPGAAAGVFAFGAATMVYTFYQYAHAKHER